METWVEGLKPGDRVIVSQRNNDSVEIVAKVTKTQIVLIEGSRYNKESLYKVGEENTRWVGRTRLNEYTQKYQDLIDKKRLLAYFTSSVFERLRDNLSLEQLCRIRQICEENE